MTWCVQVNKVLWCFALECMEWLCCLNTNVYRKLVLRYVKTFGEVWIHKGIFRGRVSLISSQWVNPFFFVCIHFVILFYVENLILCRFILACFRSLSNLWAVGFFLQTLRSMLYETSWLRRLTCYSSLKFHETTGRSVHSGFCIAHWAENVCLVSRCHVFATQNANFFARISLVASGLQALFFWSANTRTTLAVYLCTTVSLVSSHWLVLLVFLSIPSCVALCGVWLAHFLEFCRHMNTFLIT